MSNPNIPNPPQTPSSASKKKKSGSHVVLICTILCICTVLLSGLAGFTGAKLAGSNNTAQSQSSTGLDLSNPLQVPAGDSSIYSAEVIDISDVVTALRPTVVEITTEVVTNGNSIFGQYIASGAGSGVILSADGYIVTNNHVIEGARSIEVKTMDGTTYNAELVGTDPQTDIAVIKVDANNLTPAVIGNSDDIVVGQAAIAIGNPLGSLGGTVTTGIISAVGREITIENETMTLLQTDAAINSGNSGGGLFDVNGQLIGIVNTKQAASGIEGLGFAIPISDVTSVIDELVDHGSVKSRPVLSVHLQDIPEGYGETPGVYIYDVLPGGTADEAGLQRGDRIVSFDGTETSSFADVKAILKKHAVGDEVIMTVVRDGTEMDVMLTLKGSE